MTKVVIANGWTDPEGEAYVGGQTVEVKPSVARDLIARHKARLPEKPTKPEPPKPAATAEVEAVEPDTEPASDAAPAVSKPNARRAAQKEAAK